MPTPGVPDYYTQMGELTFHDPRYTSSNRWNSGYMYLMPTSKPPDGWPEGDWKFHLSIDPKDVPQAWNIVVDELKKDGGDHRAKVAKPDAAMDYANPKNIQAGKMITIYTNSDVSPEHYKELMQRIEKRLHDAGVTPGPAPNVDRSIPGSQYASYRLERGPNGNYVNPAGLENMPRERRANPFDVPDPYQGFSMNGKAPIQTPPVASRPAETVKFTSTEVSLIQSAMMPPVTTGGQSARYISLDAMNAKQGQMVKDALDKAHISYTEKTSSLNGGTRVLSITGEDIARVEALGKGMSLSGAEAGLAADVARGAKSVKGGAVVSAAMGVVAAASALFAGESSAAAVKTGVTTAVPFSDAVDKAAQGDKKAAVNSAITETTALGGAAAGAIVGTAVFPIVGTAIGAVAGGLIGGMGADAWLSYVDGLSKKFNGAAGVAGAKTDPTEEMRKALESYSDKAKMAQMSPEIQSLYELRGNPEKFAAQLNEIAKGGGNAAVAKDMKTIADENAANQAKAQVAAQKRQGPEQGSPAPVI